MVATQPDGTGIEWIGDLAELGYDYAELPLAQMMALSDEAFQELKDKVLKAELPCDVCNNFFPVNLRLTGGDVDNGKIDDYVQQACARAAELGVNHIVFGSGPAKQIPEGFSREAGYQQIVKLLERAGSIAGKSGITIVIEPLRKAECNVINTFEEGCRLAGDVGLENVKVLVDFYHLTVEKEPVEHLLRFGRQYLEHVHFANPEGRIYPKQRGEAAYAPFIDALKQIGYCKRISCEAYSQEFHRDAKQSLEFLKASFK